MQKHLSKTHPKNTLPGEKGKNRRVSALRNGLANMAVDSLYPSQRGIQIASNYAQGNISHDKALKQILRLHGVT